ncbi:protein YrbL, partial [Escherichia coli]|nr:protein YrbL [Escherichia coli]EIZ6877975.1 protein YrbL [Escherichia coli]HAO8240398.1 protein YrbL [Escherichia coli]
DIAQLRQLLKQLKRYLQDNRIVTMSLKPQNILCHRISESEVIPVVCDNIGESTLIPLATWSKWCCLRKQERLWKRFIAQPALAIALQKDLQPRESKTLALTSREA